MKPALYAIVGMQHRGTVGFVAALPAGEPLDLRREPTNQFDPKAIAVWARGTHVGYIKASQNAPLASAIDRGERPSATLHRSQTGRWPLVEIQAKVVPEEGKVTS